MNTAYLIISTVMFGLLFLIWTKSNWFNFLIKASFFGMFVVGTIINLKTFGVI